MSNETAKHTDQPASERSCPDPSGSASFNTPVYSLFVLHDNQTWEQPSFQIVSANKLTEHDIRMIAESYFDGFISYGLQEDDDCDSDNVTTISWPNGKARHPA